MLPIPFLGDLVLFHEERQRLYLLNPAAAAIWTVLDLGLPPEAAVAVLSEHSGRDVATCAADIAAFQEHWVGETAGEPEGASSGRSAREASEPGPTRHYCHHGASFSFSSFDAEVRQRVHAALADLESEEVAASTALVARPDAAGSVELLVDGQRWLAAADAGEAVGGVFQQILFRAHAGTDWLVMLHGSAAVRDGAAVIFPGRSGSGKSTLAGYLACRGFTYMSDDLVAVRSDGCVLPWPTPLSIKRGSWSVLADVYPTLNVLPEEVLGDRRLKHIRFGRAVWNKPPAPIRAIIMPRWSRRHAPETQRLTPNEALALLVNDRVWLGWPMTEAHVRRFLDWLQDVPVYRIWYDDLADAEQRVRQIFSGEEQADRQAPPVPAE